MSGSHAESGSKSIPGFQKLVVLGMVWGAFGPYVVGSARTEQLVIYGLAACIVIPFAFINLRLELGKKLLVPWVLALCVALLGVIFPTPFPAAWEPGRVLAGLDNLLLPLAVMLIVWSVVRFANAAELLRSAGKIVVWAAVANAALAMIGTGIDLSPYLRMFWGSADSEGPTTAFLASSAGRFSGILNHPAEAGVLYGLGGILAIYLYKKRSRKLFLALTFIVVGGLLCVSKVFILGGLPLLVIYLWRSRNLPGKAGVLVTAGLVMAAVMQTGWLQGWSGFDYLTRLLAPAEDQGFIEFYTAGRWNEGSTLTSVLDEVMRVSPLVGVGAGGWQVPYDSGWTEVMVMSGLLGVLLHAAVFVGLWITAKRTVDPDRRHMLLFMTIFLIGADFGIPSLTANRVATIAWVLIALAVLARNAEPRLLRAAPDPVYDRLLSKGS